MKADGFSNVLGMALANFSGTEGVAQTVGTKTYKTGTIEVFMNLTYRKLDIAKAEEGTFDPVTLPGRDFSLETFNLLGVRSITSLSGKWAIGEDGTATTTRLCLEDVCLGKSDLSILLQNNGLLDSMATSSATSTEESSAFSLSALFQNIWEAVATRLAEVGNGIGKLFAKEIYTDKLCVKKSDGTDICVTGDELATALSSGSSSSETSSSGSEGVSAPAEETASPATEIIIEETASSTPEIIIEETPNQSSDEDGTRQVATSTPEIIEIIEEAATSTPETAEEAQL